MTRRIATKRPRKTVFAPWRREEALRRRQRALEAVDRATGVAQQRPAALPRRSSSRRCRRRSPRPRRRRSPHQMSRCPRCGEDRAATIAPSRPGAARPPTRRDQQEEQDRARSVVDAGGRSTGSPVTSLRVRRAPRLRIRDSLRAACGWGPQRDDAGRAPRRARPGGVATPRRTASRSSSSAAPGRGRIRRRGVREAGRDDRRRRVERRRRRRQGGEADGRRGAELRDGQVSDRVPPTAHRPRGGRAARRRRA